MRQTPRVCRGATAVVRGARFLAYRAALVPVFATPVRGARRGLAGVLKRHFTRA